MSRSTNAGGSSRVAIVHDYLTQRGGAERVLLALSRAFPDAPVYTSFYDPDTTFPEFRERDVRPFWINRALPLRRRHRLALPLLPLVFSTASVSADVVICSSSGWAHGIRASGRKIVYCHSPAKWLYRRDEYLGAHPPALARAALRALDPALRTFDRRAAASASQYVANSKFIAAQIREVYGIDADVMFPPAGLAVEGPRESLAGLEPGFFLTVTRLLPYKNVDQVVEAFRRLPRLTLVVVGGGPERRRLTASSPQNVRFIGEVTDAQLRWLYESCSGLVASAYEDFGLTPVEAAAFGKPVAALHWGGFRDTIVADVTGLFFDAPEPWLIADTVERLRGGVWDDGAIREHAAGFSEDRFVSGIRALVDIELRERR